MLRILIAGMRMNVGVTAKEMEILDETAGERLVAAVDRREGQKKVVKDIRPTSEAREAFNH